MNVLVAANRHVGVLQRLLPAAGPRHPEPTTPAALLGMAELLDAVAFVDGVEQRHGAAGTMVGLARRSTGAAGAAARVADDHAAMAWHLFRLLLATCSRTLLRRCARLGVAVLVGGGLLTLLVLGLLVVLYVDPGPFLVVPAAVTLGLAVVLAAHWRGIEPVPAVGGLTDAATELRTALTARHRARRHAAVVHRSWRMWARRNRVNVGTWCLRHGVPADATTLRRLAERSVPA